MDTFDLSPFGSSSRFPKRGVLPKTETGALSFLRENPDFDGRGVIVAILDTGCDPGADGLAMTPDGKPKFIDVVDATGSGDCNTSKQIKISSINNNILTSPLTNNKLLLNKKWIQENKNNYFNIGLVRAYDFFPKPLVKRLEKKRTEKFGNKLNKSIETLRNDINSKTKKLKNASKDTSSEDKRRLKEEIEDLTNLTELLSKETNSGSGPVFDVIVWNDGKQYNAVLNTISMDSYVNCTELDELTLVNETKSESKRDEYGDEEYDTNTVLVEKDSSGNNIYDVSQLQVLTNYKKCYKYGTISNETLLNYVMNIYDSGNLVSIVAPGGSHGTHVAGIVGGYYKDDASLNGIAPGVQFVSIKIGDTRLSTMETNQGLMRSLYHIKQNNCDLVNMSYGEPTTAVKTGCFPKGVETLVWKHGVIFISSAGNDGPCLSSAGAPQSGTDAIIGIGAMFSPQMIESEYGLVQKGDDGQNMANYYEAYSWSSRGPTMDGAIGVKIMSPGGAIAPIPSYTLSRNQLMNGTSMSSPNACGNVALLLSALKQQKIGYTPYGIELALINSAKDNVLYKIDTCARGYALLQVHGAYEYCSKHMDIINSPITHYEININGKNHSNCRGIYIREALQSATSYNVSVTPKFHENCDNALKVQYSMKCMLKSDVNWITPAPFTLIAGNGRYFEIRVDPIKLYEMNSNKYIPVFRGYVCGINNDDISAGPLFRIPVTVCNHITYPLKRILSNPYSLIDDEKTCVSDKILNAYLYRRTDRFSVGKISRVFHLVPTGASAMRIQMKCISTKDNKQMRFCFASLYGKQREQVKFDRWARFSTGDELSTSLQRVEANTIIETTLCQYSLSFGESVMEWCVEFIGPSICNTPINMNVGDEFGLITLRTDDISCRHHRNQINPSVKFDTFVSYYQAKYATINIKNALREVGDIDLKTNEKVSTLDLEYEFDQKISASKNIIKFSLFDDLLYEALYEGNFWMLFDANKQLICSGEAFEESSKIAKQKGYVLKLQLRSSNMKLLEKAKTSTILRIDSLLSAKQQLNCEIFASKLGILATSGKITSAIAMGAYSNKDLYVTTPSLSAIKALFDNNSKGATTACDIESGSQLLGYLKLNKETKECLRPRFRNNGQRGASCLCVPIMCSVFGIAKAAESRRKLAEIKEDKKEKEEEKETLEEKERDGMIDWINKKLKGDEQKKAFEMKNQQIFQKYAKNLSVLNLKLEVYRDDDNIKLVMDICDEILNEMNLTEIAAFFGKKVVDKNDSIYKKQNKKYKEQKAAVIDALKTKLNCVKKELTPTNKKTKSDENETKEKEKKDGGGGDDAILDFVVVSKSDLKQFVEIWKQLSEWIDIEKDKKLFAINLWYNLQKGLIGKVVTIINEKISANGKDEKAMIKDQIEMKMKVYQKYLAKKEFNFLVEQIQLDIFKKFPKQYRPF